MARRTKNTEEIHSREYLIIFICIYVGLTAFFTLLFAIQNQYVNIIIAALTGFHSLIFIPCIIYQAVRYHHFRNVELKYIQSTRAVDFDILIMGRGYAKSSLCFDVEVNGEKKRVETRHIFSVYSLSDVNVNLFKNRDVEIGYDEKYDIWIVLTYENVL